MFHIMEPIERAIPSNVVSIPLGDIRLVFLFYDLFNITNTMVTRRGMFLLTWTALETRILGLRFKCIYILYKYRLLDSSKDQVIVLE